MESKKLIHKGTGIGVKVKAGTTREEKKINLEVALKRFKKKQKEYGVLFELRERSEYVKPSVKRRKELQRAVSRNNHMVAIEKEFEKLSRI